MKKNVKSHSKHNFVYKQQSATCFGHIVEICSWLLLVDKVVFRLQFCILLHLYIELTLFPPVHKAYTKKYSILYCFALHYDFRNTPNIKPSYCILFLNQTTTYKSHQCSHSFLWTVLLICLRQFVFLVTLCYWDISVPTQNKSASRQSR
jgi:hypothetical protein